MKKGALPTSPDAYVRGLRGWRRKTVEAIRKTVRESATLEEVIKWGHLVYLNNGPVLLIRAEADRILFGFWRGQRLREIESRLKPGGKYEMATMALSETTTITSKVVRQLTQEAVKLNAKLGNPTLAAKRT